MRTAADLARAAAEAGLTVAGTELVPVAGGGQALATRMQFDDPWAAARLLVVLADGDAANPVVRAWALDMFRATADAMGLRAGPRVAPELRDAVARTIHANVKDQIQFIHEPEETFQSARVTMQTGLGDCDDHARLVYALALACDIPAQILFFEKDEQPIHVVTILQDSDGMWHWAETTIDAEYGEDPLEALERLGLADAASNPFSHADGGAAGLGAIGTFGVVMASDVAARKVELNAVVDSVDADVQHCASLDAATVSAWNEFVAAWRTFYADEPGFFTAGAQGRQASEYADEITNWQDKLRPVCKLSGADLPAEKDDTANLVKWAALGIGAIGATYAIYEAVTLYKAGRRARS